MSATARIVQPRPKANRRYEERTVTKLRDGDVFTLDLDGEGNWYVATGIAHSDSVFVIQAEIGDPARISAVADQTCLVQVDYVKVAVHTTLEIDVSAWAAEYNVL